MDLALNNLQSLICHKTQPTNQLKEEMIQETNKCVNQLEIAPKS